MALLDPSDLCLYPTRFDPFEWQLVIGMHVYVCLKLSCTSRPAEAKIYRPYYGTLEKWVLQPARSSSKCSLIIAYRSITAATPATAIPYPPTCRPPQEVCPIVDYTAHMHPVFFALYDTPLHVCCPVPSVRSLDDSDSDCVSVDDIGRPFVLRRCP